MGSLRSCLILLLLVASTAEAQYVEWWGTGGGGGGTSYQVPFAFTIAAGADSTRHQFSPKVPRKRGRLTYQAIIDDTTAVKSGCVGYAIYLESDSTVLAFRNTQNGCGPLSIFCVISVDSADSNQHGLAAISVSQKAVHVTPPIAVPLAHTLTRISGVSYAGTTPVNLMGFLQGTSTLYVSSYGTLPNAGRVFGWQTWQNPNITVLGRDTIVSNAVDIRQYVAGATDSLEFSVLSSEKSNVTSGYKTVGNSWRHKIDTLRFLYDIASSGRTISYEAYQEDGVKIYEVPLLFSSSSSSATGSIPAAVDANVTQIIPSGNSFYGGMNHVTIANAAYYYGHFYLVNSMTVGGDRFDDGGYTFSPLIHVREKQ